MFPSYIQPSYVATYARQSSWDAHNPVDNPVVAHGQASRLPHSQHVIASPRFGMSRSPELVYLYGKSIVALAFLAFCLLCYRVHGSHSIQLNDPLDLQDISIQSIIHNVHRRIPDPFCTLTSKNLLSHQTWKMPSPMSTPSWNILHHLTLPFVLSAVFRCVRSLMTMYDCSSLTCDRRSDNWRTACQPVSPSSTLVYGLETYSLPLTDQTEPRTLVHILCHGR